MNFFGQLIILNMIILLITQNSMAQPDDEPYNRQNRDVIAEIDDGNVDQAIDYFEDYLEKYPGDAESLYGLAVAYAVEEDIDQAMYYMKQAVEEGMPVERFVAGPRSLLQPLQQSTRFNNFVRGKYDRLLHGPMLGDFTSHSASVWLRTHDAADVKLRIRPADNPDFEKTFSTRTSQDTDFATVVEAKGLQPETKYLYDVFVDGSLFFSGGKFKTYPREGAPMQLKFGFGGGAGYTPWHEHMWDTIRTHDLAGFFQLGDNVYTDHPEHPNIQRYCYYRRQSRPEYRRFTSEMPIYAIWDDHDFTVNDGAGGPAIDEPYWKRPVWELFKSQWANPYYGGGEDHPGVWFDLSVGDADFFFLDGRYYRENPQEVDEPSMLGDYQKQWLKEQLKNSDATFKIIASPVPFAEGVKPGSDDPWDGYPEEREEIYSFIEDNHIEGVVLIAADRHRSDAWKIERPDGYDLYEFMSSQLTNVHTHRIIQGSLFGYNKKNSFGVLDFNTKEEDPRITYKVYSIDNELIHQMTLYKSQLTYD